MRARKRDFVGFGGRTELFLSQKDYGVPLEVVSVVEVAFAVDIVVVVVGQTDEDVADIRDLT